MTSFILVAQSKGKRHVYLEEFCRNHNISKFDMSVVQKDENSKNLQSLGIEDVKRMQKQLFLKPMNSQEKVVVLDDAHLLTVEAQNALLKVLEEPPARTYIFLSSQTKQVFLPTILSRCQVVELEEAAPLLSGEEEKEFSQLLQNLPNMKLGDRLKKAEALAKEKEKALEWIEKMILTARSQMLKTPNVTRAYPYANAIKKLQGLSLLLRTSNVNLRMALEHTLLSF